ncbi:hypothetical protein DCC39_09580 [Pueribacillus theae]|uniref:Uncharacterized protein n=1 Tax=Pueribacillus theae TaxID=2171751 RepID=A0A2U1K2K7_9BACI|nr:hypothetical protein [Pueribacillus theae]PWA11213.1 hypothetical protein DCC39_09580 [Pueribacillus theae]
MNEKEREIKQRREWDNPDQMKSEGTSIYDLHEEEQNVDSIPLEDLKEEMREEKDKHDSKDLSSSERKYRP